MDMALRNNEFCEYMKFHFGNVITNWPHYDIHIDMYICKKIQA